MGDRKRNMDAVIGSILNHMMRLDFIESVYTLTPEQDQLRTQLRGRFLLLLLYPEKIQEIEKRGIYFIYSQSSSSFYATCYMKNAVASDLKRIDVLLQDLIERVTDSGIDILSREEKIGFLIDCHSMDINIT